MNLYPKLSLVPLLMLAFVLPAHGQGRQGPTPQDSLRAPAPPPAAHDPDYGSFYEHIPRDDFGAWRKKTIRKGKQGNFEFQDTDYPMGDDNPRTYRFDMGPADAPLQEGYTRITRSDMFSWEKGFGWSMTPPAADYAYTGPESISVQKNKDYGMVQVKGLHKAFAERQRSLDSHWVQYVRMLIHPDTPGFYEEFLNDMSKDAVLNPDELAFKVALPNGRYMVSLVIGDLQLPRFGMEVYANGRLAASNKYLAMVQHRGFSEPATPWVGRVAFPVDVVRNNLRIALRANENLYWERCDVTVETPDYGFSQLPFGQVSDQKKLSPFFGKRMAVHGPATQMAIAGLTITPYDKPAIELIRQKMFLDKSVTDKNLREGAKRFNLGDVEGAERDFSRIPDSNYLPKASAYLAIAGLFDTDFDEEERLLGIALGILENGIKGNPDDILCEELLRSVRFYKEGLFRMVHASERSLGQVRMEAVGLFQWTAPSDILYSKALSYIGRAYAQTDPHRWASSWYLAEEAFLELEDREPGNKVSGYYLYGNLEGWDFIDYSQNVANAPRWAVLMREAYGRLVDQIEWWGEHRQLPDGRLGGGWGDDVEIGLAWEAIMLVNPDVSAKAMKTVLAIAEGVWWSGDIDRDVGFFDGLADVEHTAEWTSDSQPLMLGIDYGNPIYYERCLMTGKLMRDLWMGKTSKGHLHFKSMMLGNDRIGKQGNNHTRDPEIDHPLNGRAVSSASWAWWYSPVDGLDRLMTGWASAWLEDTRLEVNGKPAWIIPGPIGFRTDTVGGNNATIWRQGSPKANVYENPMYAHYILSLFARMYEKTGDDVWLKPKAATVTSKEVLMDQLTSVRNIVEGSQLEDKYARLDQPNRLDKVVKIMRETWPSVTSEIANTDRIAMPGFGQVLGLLTGGAPEGGMGSIPVTFRNMSRNVAFMNLESATKRARTLLYNFGEKPETLDMLLWKLRVGAKHRVSIGVDRNDDDQVDEMIETFEYTHVHRGDSIKITAPARKAIIVDVVQIEAGPGAPARIVDLACAPQDIVYKDGKLLVTIHNIGNKDCGSFNFNVWEGNAGTGKLLGTFARDGLESPQDLEPRRTTEAVPWKLSEGGKAKITVELDPEDRYYEITEKNNVISRSVPHELKSYEVPRMWKTIAAKYGGERGEPFPAHVPKDQIR